MNFVVQKGNFDPQHIKKKYITKEIYLLYLQVEEQSPDIRSVYLPTQSKNSKNAILSSSPFPLPWTWFISLLDFALDS